MSFFLIFIGLLLLVAFIGIAMAPASARGSLRAEVKERLTWLGVALKELRKATEQAQDLPKEFTEPMDCAGKCYEEISKVDLLAIDDNGELVRLRNRLDCALNEVSAARQVLIAKGLLKADDDDDNELPGDEKK